MRARQIPVVACLALSACRGDDSDELCNFGGEGGGDGADGPWLEIWHGGQQIEDGSTLRLICGGQGSGMFLLEAHFGGFEPPTNAVTVQLNLDIPAFNVGTNQDDTTQLDCNEYCGYNQYYCGNFVTFFPPGGVDYETMHESEAELTAVLEPGSDHEVVAQFDVFIDSDVDSCGYFDAGSLEFARAPIPLVPLSLDCLHGPPGLDCLHGPPGLDSASR